MTCDRCFKLSTDGEHGEGLCPYEPRSRAHAIVPDDVPGGFVVENGFDKPTRFYSRSEHQAALAARGLEIKAKWAGPGDKHLKRMDIPCAQTLENARILLSRGTVKAVPDSEISHEERIPITVTEMSETFRYRMEP